ncbi:S-4TM family putative pore-forming effector, partial [Streptomyces sp. CC228A]|uniref:S-4TM family putative pore-forming effector n=1 Tax=Streptomyces sp. CC228A TaxID=2898186 RepID=UPI001F400248
MPTSDIPSRQNEPGTIRLLRAAAASHRQAQLLAALHLTVSAVLAGGAVLALLVPSVNTAVSLLGMLWALVYALWAAEWSKGAYRRAAVIQEVVDTELFGLPWNRAIAGDPPEAHESAGSPAATAGTRRGCATTTRSTPCPARWTCSPASYGT